MGMNTHVVGIKEPTEQYRKYKAIWDACTDAGIPIPDEVDTYFNGYTPNPNGITVDVPACTHNEPGKEHTEVVLADLPEGVTMLRFTNSW